MRISVDESLLPTHKLFQSRLLLIKGLSNQHCSRMPRRSRGGRSSSSSSSSSSRSRSRRRSRRRSLSRGSRRDTPPQDPSVGAASRRFERLGVDNQNASQGEGNASQQQKKGENLEYFKKLLQEQQAQIEELLREQKQEILSEKVDQKHSFKNRILGKQHEVNKNFINLAKKIEKFLDKQQIFQAKEITEELLTELETHAEDLIVADSARNGWLTVARLRNKCSLPSDLLKQLEKLDNQIDSRKRKADYDERPRARTTQMDREAPRHNFKSTRPGYKFQRKSPEEVLEEAVKQTRSGACSHCKEEGHFLRECAGFWTAVQEARKSALK